MSNMARALLCQSGRTPRLIQRSYTRKVTLMFVFLQEKWQNRIVPVENG